MNCGRIIEEEEEYKLEIPSRDPVCKDCWKTFETHLVEIGATDDFDAWKNQEILIR